MRQLLPDPASGVDPVDAYVAADRPPPPDRPWVLVNMVVSADGATAIDGRAGDMGGEPDRRLFHALRTVPDVILVGAGTARAENYGPPKAPPGRPAPRLAVVTASGALDPSLRFLAQADPALPRPFVITVTDCPPARLAALEEVAEVIQAGAAAADMGIALGALRQRGAAVVLCEGGPTLNGQLIARDLVDEWCLCLAPRLVSGISWRAAVGDPATPPLPVVLDRLLEEDGVLFARYLRTGRATVNGIASTAP